MYNVLTINMDNYIYKIVPASSNVNVGKKGNTSSTAQAYESLINSNLEGGWEFHNVVVTRTTIPAGCLWGLLGAKPTYRESNMLEVDFTNFTRDIVTMVKNKNY